MYSERCCLENILEKFMAYFDFRMFEFIVKGIGTVDLIHDLVHLACFSLSYILKFGGSNSKLVRK